MTRLYTCLTCISGALTALLLVGALVTGFTTLKSGAVFFFFLTVCTGGMRLLLWLSATQSGRLSVVCHVIYLIGNTLFAVFLLSFLIVQVLIAANAHTDVASEDADYILVLGAGIQGDQPSRTLRTRLRTALAFAEEHPDCTLVVCGGQGVDEICTEASVMQRWLTDNGLEESRILVEDQSVNTVQNIENAKILMDSFHANHYKTAVVSTDFHLFRARLLMKRAGLDGNAVCAPSSLSFKPLFAIREYFSIVKMIVLGQY